MTHGFTQFTSSDGRDLFVDRTEVVAVTDYGDPSPFLPDTALLVLRNGNSMSVPHKAAKAFAILFPGDQT